MEKNHPNLPKWVKIKCVKCGKEISVPEGHEHESYWNICSGCKYKDRGFIPRLGMWW